MKAINSFFGLLFIDWTIVELFFSCARREGLPRRIGWSDGRALGNKKRECAYVAMHPVANETQRFPSPATIGLDADHPPLSAPVTKPTLILLNTGQSPPHCAMRKSF